MIECAVDVLPGMTVIDVVAAAGVALIVAPIVVAVPATTPVKVAVYVPLPLSVAGLGTMVPVLVPPEWMNATVAPPVERLFPAASFACKVRVRVPPEATVLPDTVTTDVSAEIPPTVTVIVGGAVPSDAALSVARICVA